MKRFRQRADAPPEDTDDDRPSKSARKRAAQDAQKLGAQLVELPLNRLRELPLEESLLDAILAAKAIKAHGGLARQLQFIGKLMRDIDTAPIIEALAEPAKARAMETERDKRITAWRDRLLEEGEPALQALRSWRPDADLGVLAQTLERARDPRQAEAQRLGAKRELHRALRRLFAG